MEELFEKLFRKLYDRHAVKTIVVGIAVDITDTTCTVTREGQPDLKDVRLFAVEDNLETYIRVKPKDGSYVLAGIIENDNAEAFIISTSEIDNVNVKVGTLEFEMDGDKFLLKKGGENMGKLMADLIDTMKSERHMTNTGVTISLTTASLTSYNIMKTRFAAFLKDV